MNISKKGIAYIEVFFYSFIAILSLLNIVIPALTPPLYFGDSHKYLNIALNYIANGYDSASTLIEVTPGYPIILAALVKAFGRDAGLSIYLGAFQGVAVVLTYLICGYLVFRITKNRFIAFLTIIIGLFDPQLAFNSATLFTEPFFCMFQFLGIFFVVQSFDENKLLPFWTGIVILALGAWIRSTLQILIIIPVTLYLIGVFKEKKKQSIYYAIFIVSMACLLTLGTVYLIFKPMTASDITTKEKMALLWVRAIMFSDSGQALYKKLYPEEQKKYRNWIKKGAPIVLESNDRERLLPFTMYKDKKRLRLAQKKQYRWWWRTPWYVSRFYGLTETQAYGNAGDQAFEVLKRNWKNSIKEAIFKDMYRTLSKPLRAPIQAVKAFKTSNTCNDWPKRTVRNIAVKSRQIYKILKENYIVFVTRIITLTGLIVGFFLYPNRRNFLFISVPIATLIMNVALAGTVPRYYFCLLPLTVLGFYNFFQAIIRAQKKIWKI